VATVRESVSDDDTIELVRFVLFDARAVAAFESALASGA
jgi:hypothetical protein